MAQTPVAAKPLQFSLRSVFAIMLLVAVLLMWFTPIFRAWNGQQRLIFLIYLAAFLAPLPVVIFEYVRRQWAIHEQTHEFGAMLFAPFSNGRIALLAFIWGIFLLQNLLFMHWAIDRASEPPPRSGRPLIGIEQRIKWFVLGEWVLIASLYSIAYFRGRIEFREVGIVRNGKCILRWGEVRRRRWSRSQPWPAHMLQIGAGSRSIDIRVPRGRVDEIEFLLSFLIHRQVDMPSQGAREP